MDESEYEALLKEADKSQTELDKLNDEASDEILKLEAKYVKLRAPYYKTRDDVLSRIPMFWPTVLINHPQIASVIEEQDEEVIKYLRRLEVEEDVRVGYTVKLVFDENPFFENSTLLKIYRLDDPPNTKRCHVQWKEGKNFMEGGGDLGIDSRKRSHADTFVPVDDVNCGFFAWFLGESEMGSDSIGDAIKDDVYINPLQYFLADDDEGSVHEEDEEDVNGYCAKEEAESRKVD
ncbi:hypothetical protein ACOME3_004607 [Neoechinorhynchus agilis]